jgi:hypothetical protein
MPVGFHEAFMLAKKVYELVEITDRKRGQKIKKAFP